MTRCSDGHRESRSSTPPPGGRHQRRQGHYLNAVTPHGPVAVLGATTAQRLGIDRVTPGERIWVGGQWLYVAGILRPAVLVTLVAQADAKCALNGLFLGLGATRSHIRIQFLSEPSCSDCWAARSWGAANLISYADSDFEDGIGDWAAVSNATLSDDTTTAFLHADSLKAVATAAGTQQFKLGAAAGQINVTGGDKYRVSGWFRAPVSSGRTITWAMGFYTSSDSWLGWTSAPSVTLASSGSWQYESAVITAPATAGHVYGSPRITEAGVNAGEGLNLDEVLVGPYRAATLIGAHGETSAPSGYTAANSAIGPLQVYKIFYSGALPGSYTGSYCAGLPVNVTCLITYKTMDTNVADYVSQVPASRNVILVYYQEPENDSFSYRGLTGGPAFVAEFEAEAGVIRTAARDAPNVMVAMDSAGYPYRTGHSATGCSFIPPASSTDMYLLDHYEVTASGNNMATDSGASDQWDNWLSCVSPRDKPIGLAEYGLNCNGASPARNAATTYLGMAADNSFQAGQPDGLPVVMWGYWYDSNVGCNFTAGGSPDGTRAVTEWQSIETQNGGGAN